MFQSVAKLATNNTLKILLQSRPDLYASLHPFDHSLAGILEEHQGRARAIGTDDLGIAMWGEFRDCWPVKCGEPWRRFLSAQIQRLRNVGLRVAAAREKPHGYYLCATTEEADAYARLLFGEAMERLNYLRLFSPKRDWYRELSGQLKF
jgi:hypothetical protein